MKYTLLHLIDNGILINVNQILVDGGDVCHSWRIEDIHAGSENQVLIAECTDGTIRRFLLDSEIQIAGSDIVIIEDQSQLKAVVRFQVFRVNAVEARDFLK